MKAALFAVALLAQAFETSSVKNSAPNNPNGSIFDYQTGGGLRVQNGTLRGLIESAYDVRDFQIAGGPAWIGVDRFDVIARSESGAAPVSRDDDIKRTRVKLQALLAERFQVVLHRETRDLQEYALTIARGGPKVAAAPVPLGPRSGIQSATGHMTATQTTMPNLAYVLSRRLQRPVVDRTGLKDRYSFELDWRDDVAGDSSSDAPSIFTALEEKLGLRLESIKGPVETIVVDRAERPSAD